MPHKLCLAAALLAAPVGLARAETLSIGDAAPPLAVTHWLRGEPVEWTNTKDHPIVVVEFWATWCGPCIMSMPHLNQLQKDFASKGVRIIGVTEPDEDNTLAKVQGFIKDQAGNIGYTMAFDERGETHARYMKAARIESIPTVFVVDAQRRVAWIGHPMGELDTVLSEMIAGTYDIQLARKLMETRQQLEQAYNSGQYPAAIELADRLIQLKPADPAPWLDKFQIYDGSLQEHDKAMAAAKKAIELARNDPEMLATIAGQLARTDDPQGYNALAFDAMDQAATRAPADVDIQAARFSMLAALGRIDEALAAAEKSIPGLQRDPAALVDFAGSISMPAPDPRCHDLALKAVELAIAAQPEDPNHLQAKFSILAFGKKDHAAAEETGRLLLQKAANDPKTLNNFAWGLLTDSMLAGRHNALALAVAERAYQASGGMDWTYLDTLALAKFENGAIAEAVDLERRAIEKCSPDDPAMSDLKTALARFEAALQRPKDQQH